MWLSAFLAPGRPRPRPARRRDRLPLRCEALEDRCLPSSYGFTEIAEFGPNSYFSQPIMTGTLNDHGTVTFRAHLSSGGEGAFTRDMQGNLGIIALTDDVISAMHIGGRINDSGTVSFGADLRDGTQAVFTGNRQGLTRITDTRPDSPFSDILPQAADVTNQGLVAFRATLKSGGTGVFTERAGEPPQTLYVTGGRFADILNQNIQRNGSLVAVLATLSAGGEGVFLGDGVTTTTIVTTGNTYSAFAAPVANDSGLVAFDATRTDGSQAIMTGDGTRLTTVAATGGPFRDFTGNVSINNDGQIVFAADLASGGRGIFSVRGGAVDEIIGTGAPLFGSTVRSFAAVPFSPRALNNFGQFGFLANLADGRTVWVRADSLTVSSAADSGPGSLRAAIAAAQSGDTIRFDPRLAGQTITLTGGELAITKSLDIEGLGPDQLTVSGNHASRVFDISGGVTVAIAGLTMTDGLADGSAPVLASTGGAILNFGALTLADDVLSNNQAVGDASTSPLGKPGRALGSGLANLGPAPLPIF